MTNKQIGLPTDGKQNVDPDISPQSENRDPATKLMLGKTFLEVYCSEEDHIHGFELILESAKQGNMEAQFRLADLYALGQGTKKNQANAYQWYTKAALQGYKKALIRIHNLYQQDKRMRCRGQLNSNEKEWADEEFKKEHNIRELNEYRREQHAPILNNIVNYYTEQFRCYKSSKEENTESDLNLAFLYQYGYGIKKNRLLAFDFYKKAAEKGHKDAQYGLAYLYQINPSIKFHYRLALRWYRTSATNGNIAAQNCLAYFYEKGLATESSYEGALYWYTKAANAGSSSAQLNLGRLYRKGEGVVQNLSEATKWYELAADQGNSAAQNCLNQLHLTGKISATANSYSVSQPVTFTLRSKLHKDITALKDSEHKKNLKKLVQHAFMTDGNAMFQIGLKYYNGEDLPQDKDTGFQWIKKAAKAGIEEAELEIAKMYEDGDAVDQDYHKSSIWTLKSVTKKNTTALLKLGVLYKNGFGVRKDSLEASRWFTKSAERENANAQFQFGLLRYYGEGVRQDKKEARECFTKSALLGNADAFYQFGWIYENDDFEGRDILKEISTYKSTLTPEEYKAEEVIKMYRLSARLGNQDAHFRLAKIYEEGKLTQKDLIKAREHYITAANSNNPHYQTELALKYINGDFGDVLYAMAVDLLKKAAEKNEYRAIRILQTPTQPNNDITSYSKIIDMLNFASAKGIDGIQFSIGHAYENGIAFKDEVILRKNENDSNWWYSVAAKMGDSRAKYKMQIKNKKDIKYQNIVSTFYSLAYESGNSDIAYDLALLYLHGEHVSKDFIRAFNLLTAASNMGHREARERLVISEKSESMAMFEAVAISGNVAIQYQLGIYFEDKNDSRSIKWFTRATKGGLNDAYYRLGVLYEEGKATPTDYSKAIASYEKAIELDHEDALYRLAQIYHYGRGIEHDYLKAYELYRRAANIGHIGALKILNLNEKRNAFSREKSNEEPHAFSSDELTSIISMLELVAEQGNVDLQFELGYFYENSEDNQKYSKALKWYAMATAANHTEAIYHLGLLYENGLGAIRDYEKSLQLYNKAKDQGSHYALYRLGILFHHGAGVDENPTKAVDCYTKAAKLGNHESQHTLGKLYETGELVQRDLIKALILYTDAYMNGNTDVKLDLYNLYDDQSYEYFSYQRLSRILTKLERIGSANNNTFQNTYGYMYYSLGRMYLEGIGTTKNSVEALKSFLIAENQYGYSDAKKYTAIIYDEKRDEKKTYIKRMQVYFDIKDTLSGEQQYRIGMLYYNDTKCFYEEDSIEKNNTTPLLAVSKDDNTAFQYMLLASKNKHTQAQVQLGVMYYNGNGAEKNCDEAIKWIQQSIKEMSPFQCYKEGMKFYQGNEFYKNDEFALLYLKNAAEKNYRKAQIQLNTMGIHGYDYEKNNGQAMERLDGSANEIEYTQSSIKEMTIYEYYEQGMKLCADKNYEEALFYIKKAAEKNNRKAKAQLGSMYFYGHGVKRDEEEAMEWIQQSIIEMREFECYTQGMKFYQDSKANNRYKIVLPYLKKALEKNHCEAQAQLGIMHFHGYGVEQNREKAMHLLEESTKKMVGYDLYRLGMKYYNNIEIDDEIALLYLEKAAKENYEDARAQLGLMYSNGHGVEKNLNKAMEWIESSVKNMMPHQCYNHGIQFFNCNEIDQHYQFSLIYFRRAAEKNHAYSQAQLGYMYLNGYGVKQDSDEAFQWYNKAIHEYSDQHIYKIGQIYHYDSGGIQDFSKAFEFYHRESGDTDKSYALHGIGLLYEYGDGVSQDYKKAFEYYRQSTEFSNIGGYFSLGLLFYCGKGVNQEYNTAFLIFTNVTKIASDSDEMYVFIENVNADSKNDATVSTHYKHSLVTSDRICGEAHYYMGLMCENGQGRHKNEREARMHFEEAFERGVQRAEFFLE